MTPNMATCREFFSFPWLISRMLLAIGLNVGASVDDLRFFSLPISVLSQNSVQTWTFSSLMCFFIIMLKLVQYDHFLDSRKLLDSRQLDVSAEQQKSWQGRIWTAQCSAVASRLPIKTICSEPIKAFDWGKTHRK